MNKIQNFEVVLDADDVLLDCNRYALNLLEQKEGRTYSIDKVTGWGLLGIPEDKRLEFLKDREFYRTQPALPGAQEFLRDLMKMAHVTIMTAVYPQFMGDRIQRLSELFPEFPMENIIMGKRKELLNADVILDDGVHNLLTSGASLPVLFRQPWNRSVSGICCVNYYHEFLSLIRIMTGNVREDDALPKVLCIVGPSGSGKHHLANELCQEEGFTHIHTCTTSSHYGHNRHVTPETFKKMAEDGFFMETTYYGGDQYGLSKQDIDDALESGNNAVAVMDISGCMAVHNRYPGQCRILYVDRDKRGCIDSILRKENMTHEQTVDRILSFDFEIKNKVLADQILTEDADGTFAGVVTRLKKELVK